MHRLDPGASRHSQPPPWIVALFAIASLVLVPTAVVLVSTLPSRHQSEHWDVAWGGFDFMLAAVLLAVAVAAWRRSPWLEGAAAAAATLLVVDAWFDVLTASSRSELILALTEAVLIEGPLAILCLWIARDAERVFALADPHDRAPAPGTRRELSRR